MATPPRDPIPPDELLDGDIEILEVVSVDEDAPPISAEGVDADEVEVLFDEPAAPSSAARPAAAAGDADGALHDRMIRLRADFENFKKRVERDRADNDRHATGILVARLLPVLDNFERAMAAARPDGDEGFREGIALIQKQLLDELRREGLIPMHCEGMPFDPTIHEAVATEVTAAFAPNTVVREMQRGYFFHDRVLRPALVRVSVDPDGDANEGVSREEN